MLLSIAQEAIEGPYAVGYEVVCLEKIKILPTCQHA